MDSFFARVVRAMPLECGLPGPMHMLDPGGEGAARRLALDRAFRMSASDDRTLREFMMLLNEQSRGRESRRVVEMLDRLLEELLEDFEDTPRGVTWGDAARIWPRGCPLASDADALALFRRFRRVFEETNSTKLDDKHHAALDGLETALGGITPGAGIGPDLRKFAVKCLSSVPHEKKPGVVVFKISRSHHLLPDTFVGELEELGRALVWRDFQSLLGQSAAVHALMRVLAAAYHADVRGAGWMTFSDVTRVVARGGLDRALIDFRLDARFDHWLLDEFQDTSRIQWEALQPLIDEVLQSDGRTFFYVGDTKQAIYAFRGGDPRLFDEIFDYYNRAAQTILDGPPLDKSYRSVPEILNAVNALFDPAHLAMHADVLGIPDSTVGAWGRAWAQHSPARTALGQGVFSWEPCDEDTMAERVAAILCGIDPASRGLSAAVIVRENSRIAPLVGALREAGLHAVGEGLHTPATDNDVCTAVLALLRAAAHPEDRSAVGHVRMTPLRGLAEGPGWDDAVLGAVARDGFAGAIAGWTRELAKGVDGFARERIESLITAARAFDARDGCIDAFLDWVSSTESRPNAVSAPIRVLTIHAAKGLDFDVVVLPWFGHRGVAHRIGAMGFHMHRDAAGRIDWALNMPAKDLCQFDETLASVMEDAIDTAAFEGLCINYVALTRAKRAVYALSVPLQAKSTSTAFSRMIEFTWQTDAVSLGNPDWFLEARPASVPARKSTPTPLPPGRKQPAHLPRQLPSSTSPTPGTRDRRALGERVHHLLAGIDWLTENPPRLPDDDAGRTVARFLASDTGQTIFRRPHGSARVLREQSFDVVMRGKWVSGIFDRVVISDSGVEVYEFKTSENLSPHLPQLENYLDAARILTGQCEIRGWVVSLATGEMQAFS
jgi:superfamily I DNA/RNA helicase